MKGVQGLVIAVVLGLIGGAVNWKYLYDQSNQGKTESFVIVRKDKKVKQGQEFREGDLTTVSVPKDQAATLREIAFTNMGNVVGLPATRDYQGNDIVLQQELKTLPHGALPLDPEKNEVAIHVRIDQNSVTSSHIIPGRTPVKFRLPRAGAAAEGARPEDQMELVGPYEVLAVGNRRGDVDTMRSQSIRTAQDDKLTIRGRLLANGQLDALSARLMNYRDRSGNRPVDVVILPEAAPKK